MTPPFNIFARPALTVKLVGSDEVEAELDVEDIVLAAATVSLIAIVIEKKMCCIRLKG